MTMTNAFLTSHAVAELIGVSPSTVLSWIDKGLLPAFRTPGGHRRVEPNALLEFLRAHQMPVPRTLLPQAKRMLLIDDDVVFLRSTKRALKQQFPDLEVEMAESPVEGLLKVGTDKPDAVLLDATMPGMDGVEVCRQIRQNPATANVAVIALTGRLDDEVVVAFKQAGAAACLRKPLDINALLQLLGL
jgi:excisionase family DNA binding protein